MSTSSSRARRTFLSVDALPISAGFDELMNMPGRSPVLERLRRLRAKKSRESERTARPTRLALAAGAA